MRNIAQNTPILEIQNLQVYYGQSHALQGVDIRLTHGVFSIIGRNGMGKTTLCNRLMGLLPHTGGSVRFMGYDITKLPPHTIAKLGIGYVPQGRKLWKSLTVAEHLRLFNTNSRAWNTDRIYSTFPQLLERKNTQAGQLSGGEQQMLALSRALLQDPKLLLLDEPTEGLAPVIVQHVENLITQVSGDGHMAVLLIEQNIHTALNTSEQVGVMVNGRLQHIFDSVTLKKDIALQKSLLGVQQIDQAPKTDIPTDSTAPPESKSPPNKAKSPKDIPFVAPTRWTHSPYHTHVAIQHTTEQHTTDSKQLTQQVNTPLQTAASPPPYTPHTWQGYKSEHSIYVVGTFDTKAQELLYIKKCLIGCGKRVHTVDISTANTTGYTSVADTPPHVVAGWHPKGSAGVFNNNRGDSVTAMATAVERWLVNRTDIGGIISAGGSGAAALISGAMQALPVGMPKVLVTTMASGDVRPYVGASDILMMNPVTDVQGLNSISRQILKNASHAVGGMVSDTTPHIGENSITPPTKPTVGLTMFGVTTPAVQKISKLLEPDYDPLVFHATGIGGQSLEKLVDNTLIDMAIDLTTTEVCDLIAGGVLPAHTDRLGAFIRNPIPYVGSLGAVDMVNFNGIATVPKKYKNRNLVVHNSNITLMRTNTDENQAIALWLCKRLNAISGPVRFLIPQGGVSALDAPNQPFYDPEANQVLFDTIQQNFKHTQNRRLIITPHHINDDAFATAVYQAFTEIRRI